MRNVFEFAQHFTCHNRLKGFKNMIFKDMINFYQSLFYHLHFLQNVIRLKIKVDKKSRLPRCFRRKVVDPSVRLSEVRLMCIWSPLGIANGFVDYGCFLTHTLTVPVCAFVYLSVFVSIPPSLVTSYHVNGSCNDD